MTAEHLVPEGTKVLRRWDPPGGVDQGAVVWLADVVRRRRSIAAAGVGALVMIGLLLADQVLLGLAVMAVAFTAGVLLGQGGSSGYYVLGADDATVARLNDTPELVGWTATRP